MKNQLITKTMIGVFSLLFVGTVYATNNYSTSNYPNSNVESQKNGNDGIVTNTVEGSESATGKAAQTSTVDKMKDDANYNSRNSRRTDSSVTTHRMPTRKTEQTNYVRTRSTTGTAVMANDDNDIRSKPAPAYRRTSSSNTIQKSTSSSTVSADNTGKNVRDRNGSKLTPENQAQGTNADVEITRMIRQQIVKDDNLSVNAKNVKIITLNNVVTLRGPVNSQAEKNRIVQAAQSVAGNFQIQNELEVVRK